MKRTTTKRIDALLIVVYLLVWAFAVLGAIWSACMQDFVTAAPLAVVAWLSWRAARAVDELDRLKKD